jgi:hypothetical protein
MELVNIILSIAGIIVLLFGLFAFLNPNFARLINIPIAEPRLKSLIAIIIGIILIPISFFVNIPTN